jgi:SAM-dependent methyltransferase
MHEIDPPGTYRPQFRLRWRGLIRLMDMSPRLKARLADAVRGLLRKFFDPEMVTTERVIEYPFVFQSLCGITGRILDVGCSSSGLPIALASRGYRVVGFDSLPYAFRHTNLQAIRGDAIRPPFRDASFEAILAISVLEHVGIGHYGDPVAASGDCDAAREISRILQPGGRAVITVPFGQVRTDDFQRVYDPPRLRTLLSSLAIVRIEYAKSTAGLWSPCSEADASLVDWAGPDRAVALVVATNTRG